MVDGNKIEEDEKSYSKKFVSNEGKFSTIGSRIFTPLNFSDSIVNSTDHAKFQLSRGPLLPDINKFDESSRHKLHSRLDERDKCFNRNVRQSS